MDKPTFALVENPIHPVLVLVNKVSIWGSFFPVGVLNYLICVVVPAVEVKRLLKILLERKKTPDRVGLKRSFSFCLGKVEGWPKVVTLKFFFRSGWIW